VNYRVLRWIGNGPVCVEVFSLPSLAQDTSINNVPSNTIIAGWIECFLIPFLEFKAKTCGKDVDGTAVLVIRGISCQLIVEGQVYTFEELAIVVSFENVLRGVVGQFPVPDQNSKSPVIEEFTLCVAESAQHVGQTHPVVRTVPSGAFE